MSQELKEVKLSDRNTVHVRALNAYEMVVADSYGTSRNNGTQTDKIYAICTVRKVNGQEVYPLKNMVEFSTTAQRFSLVELMMLIKAYTDLSTEDMGEDLKKELEALASDSSQPQA